MIVRKEIITMYFLFDRECDKKGVRSDSEWRKTINEGAMSFWLYCKNNTKFYCFYKNPDGDFESVVERFTGKEEN